MVQILNKIVQINTPFQKYGVTYYPIASFKAEICYKVEESVPQQSGTIALHKSFLQGKYCTQFCLFVLANQMQACTCNTQIFGYLWHLLLFSNAFFKALWNTSPSRFVSTALYKSLLITGKIRRVLHVNFECLFWPIKCMHSKPRFWVHFSHVFTSKMPSLRL